MVEHKPLSLAAVPALWTLVTLLIKLIRILLKRKYIQAKLFFQKSFIPITRAAAFMWDNFKSSYWDLGCKNQHLGHRTNPASHMITLKLLWRKEWWGKILETKPAWLTRFIWKGSKWNLLSEHETFPLLQKKLSLCGIKMARPMKFDSNSLSLMLIAIFLYFVKWC